MRKKGIVFIIVLGIVCLCAIGDAFAATIVTSDYWILGNGYEANFDKGMKVTTSPLSIEFYKNSTSDGSHNREYDSSGNMLHSGYVWDTGNYYTVEPAKKYYPNEMEIGKTYSVSYNRKEYDKNGTPFPGLGHEDIETVVTGPETINVPAGSFKAYKFRSDVNWRNAGNDSGTSVYEYWLAKGVGIVKMTRGGETYKLQSYVSLPTAETHDFSYTSAENELSGTVQPNGAYTDWWFEYRAAGEAGWDKTGGDSVSASPGKTEVTETLTGLDPDKTYTYRLVAQNSVGTGYGEEKTFRPIPETGHMAAQNLWIRAVIHTEGDDPRPIEAVWKQGGQDTTDGGNRVIWGYFYASPDDVSWGNVQNPDLFVKIWFDAGGRTDVNFFHVSVPNIEVFSTHYGEPGFPSEQGMTTTDTRYIRHYYENGVGKSDKQTEDGIPANGYFPGGDPDGYLTINELRIGAIINTVGDVGAIDAIWKQGGNAETAGGHHVVWGHFYASPDDVPWGNAQNPDLFVKIWFDASGRIDVNFFHVSVPDIEVYSDFPGDGAYDGEGTTIMDDRYIRHEYWMNQPPVAVIDNYSTNENAEITIRPLDNDSDPDGDALTVTILTQPSNGTLTDKGDGTYTYKPDSNYAGGDSFTYEVSDGQATATGMVSITVNDAPVAEIFTNALGMTFNRIPAGTFMMGSPEDEPERYNNETQHQVTLRQDFHMQTTEVTQGQWEAVMGENPSDFQNCGDDCPVETVSWDDVQDFITRMNQRGEGTYRLPTEAEWEYAARAGTSTPFYFGQCLSTDQANYDGNYPSEGCPRGEYRSETVPVASLASNAWGLYDMHGNVWEWCSDWYEGYPTGAVTDPSGPGSGSSRVVRGGSWGNYARNCRSAIRYRNTPGYRNWINGFRLVLSPGQK